MRYIVTAAYLNPVSLYSTSVEADTPEQAEHEAWLQCCDDNGWKPDDYAREDEWASDVMIEPVTA